jgi:2-oxoglutarate ferredoxin oxidoreductase subunit beta
MGSKENYVTGDWTAAVPAAEIQRELAGAPVKDPIPVGILYQNPEVPCYEDLRHAGQLRTADYVRAGLEAEFDKFTVWPAEQGQSKPAA